MSNAQSSTGFIKTVLILLKAARTPRLQDEDAVRNSYYAAGHLIRQLTGVHSVLLWRFCFFAFLNALAAFSINMTVKSAQCIEVESHGRIVVSSRFLNTVKQKEANHDFTQLSLENAIDKKLYQSEAHRISKWNSESEKSNRTKAQAGNSISRTP